MPPVRSTGFQSAKEAPNATRTVILAALSRTGVVKDRGRTPNPSGTSDISVRKSSHVIVGRSRELPRQEGPLSYVYDRVDIQVIHVYLVGGLFAELSEAGGASRSCFPSTHRTDTVIPYGHGHSSRRQH